MIISPCIHGLSDGSLRGVGGGRATNVEINFKSLNRSISKQTSQEHNVETRLYFLSAGVQNQLRELPVYHVQNVHL